MPIRVFVDGEEGTTGLQIRRRLERHDGVDVLAIDPSRRKDPQARQALLSEADVAFLCLPDGASREAVQLAEGHPVRLIDASTAFRTDSAWVYGLPELGLRDRLRTAARVSVPGCYATGFLLLVAPLVRAGILPSDYPVACHAVSGFSGRGKKGIAEYAADDSESMRSPRHYALGLAHKHVPEMHKMSGLDHPPHFMPIIGPYFAGMVVSVALHTRLLAKSAGPALIREAYALFYRNEPFIRVLPENDDGALDDGFLPATCCNGTNRVDSFTCGTPDLVAVMARFDNLGKGASGAAVQCMNVMCGFDEVTGTTVEADRR